MRILYRANQGQLKQLFTMPIPVITFFCTLFIDKYANILLNCHPDNNSQGSTLKDTFWDAFVSFTHFGEVADDWCMSHESMFIALCHHMVVSC